MLDDLLVGEILTRQESSPGFMLATLTPNVRYVSPSIEGDDPNRITLSFTSREDVNAGLFFTGIILMHAILSSTEKARATRGRQQDFDFSSHLTPIPVHGEIRFSAARGELPDLPWDE